MNISITIDNGQIQRLMRTFPVRAQRALAAGMTDATLYLQRLLMDYPAQRRLSTYKRTNTLKRSWLQSDSRRVRPTSGGGVEGGIYSNANIAPYNRLVQDADQQARIHRGVWRGHTVQDVAGARQNDIRRMFAIRLREEFSR